MRSAWWGLLGLVAAGGACDSGGPSRSASIGSALVPGSIVAEVGATSALSTPAQRHMVRVQPAGHAPVYLLAVQNDGLTTAEEGLLWYRSDDGGTTWSHYGDIVARPDPAGYDPSRWPATLHLTADLVVVGDDVAAVYSYDSTSGTMPGDAWDPDRAVYFQWWRFDGVNDWVAGPRSRIAAPAAGQAYHRAELARDGAGRLWIQAFLRQSDCSSPGTSSCVGDLLRVWVSADGGATFQGPQTLASVPNAIGGGRLASTGTGLVMLWAGTSSALPAQLMTRSDADPVGTWSPPRNAFADGSRIYHGAALSAVPDGGGGLHLVYKQWVSLPDDEQLFYRHFDGTSFGAAIPVGSFGDWALQPAVTRAGNELYVCSNQTITPGTDYEMRSYRLGAGFSAWTVIDGQVQGKAYPAAPEIVPASDATIPCAFGMGDQTTSFWGPGHVVAVAQEPAQPSATPIAATPVFTPAAGAYTSQQSVGISDATPGATITYTLDGTPPTTSSTPYAGPIAIAATTTIRAIAAAPGFATSAVASATYTIQAAPPPPPPPPPPGSPTVDYGAGFGAAGLQLNGSAALSGTRLRLTSTTAQAGSAFATTPVNVASFTTDFRFQLTNAAADGITFTLQGIGPGALGPHGGGLGYGPDTPGLAPGIAKSVALKLDLYDNAGEGVNSTGLYLNGVSPTVPSVALPASAIDLHGGHPFDVHLTYDGATLRMTITDAVTGGTASASFPVDIPSATGSATAFAGFTAGTGGLSAVQEIVSWTFTPG